MTPLWGKRGVSTSQWVNQSMTALNGKKGRGRIEKNLVHSTERHVRKNKAISYMIHVTDEVMHFTHMREATIYFHVRE